jgi:hypothetical protein
MFQLLNHIKQFGSKIVVRIALLCVMLSLIENTVSAQRKIILKLDDISVKNSVCPATATLDYLVSKKIKASIGAVGTKFDATALSILYTYLNASNLSGEKLFEIWHHGLDHIDPEFSGTGYAYQKWHFDSATTLIKNYLRLQMKSFGAPFNHSDTNTNKVLAEDANYKVSMFMDIAPAASILNLTNRVNMENGTGNPQFSYFDANYNTYKDVYTDYMVLQGHPNVWTAAHVTEFARIIDSLVARGCEFVTPYGYYLSLNPSTPVPTTAQTISFAALPSKLVGDADFSAGATASSGLTVQYNSSNTSVATVTNGVIHVVGAGTAIIIASQEGNATYKQADYVSQTLIVNAIDYRSAVTTGSWNTATSWESRSSTGTWAAASSVPTAANNVYIQNGHTITVNIANAYCNDLHMNTSGVFTIGNNTINVNGKIRAYTGTAVTGAAANDGTFYSGQTSTTTLVSTMITTSNGFLKFVGPSRSLTNTGEWAGAGTAQNTEVALDAGATGVLGTAIKCKVLTLSSGILSTAYSLNIGSTTGNGITTIKSGTKLISSRTYVSAGSQAITYSSANKTGTVSIESGGTLELAGASPVIDCTTFTNNGTVAYSGTAQTLLQPGGASGITLGNYNNLNIDGSGSKTLSTATTVSGTLSVLEGRLVTGSNNLTLGGTAVLDGGTSLAINGGTTDFANKSVTLRSVASESGTPETAYIETIIGTLNNATNVTVQQYIPGGYRTFRFLGHPFTTAQPLSQITDNIDITGNGGSINGFTTTVTNNASSLYFNTATANGAASDGGWIPFTSALTNSWIKGQGIRVLVRGSKGQAGSLSGTTYTPDAVTLDMNGTINTGAVSTSLSAAGTGSTQGFNLVGNPYPSPVDIGAVLTAASNIGSTFYVRNPQTGSYITVNPIPASYMLPANSAFFAVATATTNLNFGEANKHACTSCPTVFRTSNVKNHLQLKALKNGMEYDNLHLYLDSQFNNNYERNLDATKLLNDGLSLYSIAKDSQRLAVDYRSFPTLSSIIPLGIKLPIAYGKQQYVLQFTDCNLQEKVSMQLHDKLNNSYTSIKQDATYVLHVDPSNTSSIGEERLEIIVSKQANPSFVVSPEIFSVAVSNTANGFLVHYENKEAANTTIRLMSADGKFFESISLGQQQQGKYNLPSSKLANGLYLIEVQMGNSKLVRKVIK